MQTLQSVLLALTSVVGVSSILAALLRSFIEPLRAHAARTSWATDNALVELYATLVEGFCTGLAIAKKVLDKVALNPKPTVVQNGKELP